MKPPENPQPAARPVLRAGVLVLAALPLLPFAGMPQQAPDAEVRSVSSDVEPCLSVRSRPSRRARIVDCLEPGRRVTVTGTRGLWRRVSAEGGVLGWVTSGFLVAPQAAPPSATPDTGAVAPASREPERPQEPATAADRPTPPVPEAGGAPGPVQRPPVRIVVAGDPVTGPAQAAGQAPPARRAPLDSERARAAEELAAALEAERDRLAERARAAEELVAALEAERDRLAERARAAEELTAALEAERGQLAERARLAEERAAALEVEHDRLAERARLAEERVAGLQVEAEAEAGDDALATAAGAPTVEELIRERDELDGELKRAQARMLYLRSDLEETRAELMRLKGVPAQLVQPEPEPEAVAARPAPEPAPPADAAAPEAPAPPATPSFVVMDEVVGTVRAWAQAWADQRANDYLAFYAPSFTPPEGQSREVWAAGRRERIGSPRSIVIALDRINPIVSGDRASVSFVQSYTSDTFSDTVAKTLVLERAPTGGWQIVEERLD